MWPFKTLDERIASLEDSLAGKKAKLSELKGIFASLEVTNHAWIQQQANLAQEVAELESKISRLKALKEATWKP